MQSPNITSMDDVEILRNRYLGHGYISTVKMARDRRTGQTYAVKIVR